MKNIKTEYWVILILLLFYSVGTLGFAFGIMNDLFLRLTPFQLLLTFGLLIYANKDHSKGLYIGLSIVFLIGYWIEVIGVHTGVLFGEYAYGKPLGLKLFEVPLMIGINWFVLSFSSFGISIYLFKNKWIQAFFASSLMVGLDFLIEPVAIYLDFWRWTETEVPVRNYIMWFITAFIIQIILKKVVKKANITISLAVFLIQILFFLILNIVFK